MTKPYNDEEFEVEKEKQRRRGSIELPVIDRLIATVESLKENRRLWVSEADRYMQERDKAREENKNLNIYNAVLEQKIVIRERIMAEQKEDNEKLKAELDDSPDCSLEFFIEQEQQLDDLIRVNEKLKAELKHSHTQNKLYQLDELFKYCHEMTKEQAQEHCQAFLSEFD